METDLSMGGLGASCIYSRGNEDKESFKLGHSGWDAARGPPDWKSPPGPCDSASHARTHTHPEGEKVPSILCGLTEEGRALLYTFSTSESLSLQMVDYTTAKWTVCPPALCYLVVPFSLSWRPPHPSLEALCGGALKKE